MGKNVGRRLSKSVRNKHGSYVSAAKHRAGKRNPWIRAVNMARRQLGIRGFMPVRKGTRLYALAKQIQATM